MDIATILTYTFIERSFIAGVAIALTCSSLGMFLVLRKMSLIGDGLSHVSFGAIALGLFFGIYPTYVAIPIVIIASLFILKITEKANIYGDAAIGIVSAVGIAGGVILASASGGFNVDLFSYLFGNILSISTSEVIWSIVLSVVVLVTLYFNFWDLFSITFDEEYAKSTGIQTGAMNALLTILTAITVVLSVKMVGVMLVSALLILPATTALQEARSFRASMGIAGAVSVLSVLSGITLSFYMDLPSGATIVMVNVFFFALSLLYKKFH